MADEEDLEGEDTPKKSKKGLLVGLVLALAGGGGAFFALYSGLLLAPAEPKEEVATVEKTDKATFVPIEPLIISLGRSAQNQLRFSAEIEVHPEAKSSVENVMPRIVDVLNGYLRAVDIDDLKNPSSLVLFRGQMLRRIELVTGKGHVKDLLITEFVVT